MNPDLHHLVTKNIEYNIKKKSILKGISLSISSGEITGFLGPNGAGKTTCFHILAGLIQPHRGEIFLDQQNIDHLHTHQRLAAGIGFLPQNSSIFQGLSVEKNLCIGLEFHPNKPDKSTQNQRIDTLLEQFNLGHLRNHLGISLSGGERRRVELARCLITQPKFILLDEPFAGIDPITIKTTKKMLKSIAQQGTGIMISDHNAHDTLNLCQQIYLLHEGRIIAHDTPHNIRANTAAQAHYLGQT